MKKGNYFIGLILIAFGAVALILNTVFDVRLFKFDFYDFWVFIILLVGLAFELGFFLTGSKPGLLVPGGIITTIGLLLMFEVSTDWHFARFTWPVYIISVAVGLLQMYLFSKRERGLLIAGLIVGGIGAVFELMMITSSVSSNLLGVLIPISLVAGGIALVCSSSGKGSRY
ncbi:hypothetical protein LY28_02017 [Ruminiclostridium sufflavum DSM 19573]|uniref:DUF5668 domain-containing protein n=1 Tax=Ruminiclostridium sufflavum DSM 19573 TaxID=1121337 RepID=A0A318XK38_9FIRM|nr:hypothetical protein [Ruminiclostridium sufflavum]PYG87645.1 hypothetical protein LY28_02017 [Ruminiclostridium sufflavum DSM 19573]